MRNALKVGDRVAYSAAFLRNCGIFTGEMPGMRGTITGFEDISHGWMLAIVNWDGHAARKVNIKNIAKVGSIDFTGV